MQKDKKELKRLYDIEYRRKNKELLKHKKAAHYREKVDHYRQKEKERREKPENKTSHNAYCMRPEYVKKKRVWDVVNRSMKYYGEFWESAILVNQIEIEIRKIIPRNERSSTRRCVKANTERNCKRRLEVAITKIMNGETDRKILSSGWLDESKEILEALVIAQ